MFRYYLGLGFRSLRRNPVLTVLMVLTLSVGVAASMTTLTLLHGMSGDPIPGKSDRLFVPRLDNAPADNPPNDGEPATQVTHTDAMALWEQGKGKRRTPIYGLAPAIDSGRADLPPFFSEGVAVGADFFPMFDVPFLYGQAWSAAEDAKAASVVVIGRGLSERVFGEGVDPVGKTVRISDADYSIVGVVDTWNPVPKFYRLIGNNQYGTSEDVFIPFRTAIARELQMNGSIDCSASAEPGFKGIVASECVWMSYWVELESAADRQEYADYLNAYVNEQKALGRFPRPLNNRLHNVMEWLDFNEVVSDDTRTSTWLAFGFLLVCLVNTVGLLLAKFSARPGEIGVRRALGATRRDVFTQYLTEAGVIGLVGAAVGVGLTFAALAFIRGFDDDIALITRVDGLMLTTAIVLSVAASLLAGLLPTWRACQVVPAMQLKSQ
ncbi:ABC transporter permease [Arenimonas terrae]|jgi:putative ABC transport system permease protein|uniref:FtsX-like permease family protein n=1 Tax=Arenimonas terrae TaxID=2546226 RepID=A0A5C4RPQ8_9GAMM|nr:ABC transporter permease [Arenimonas terrae]TNJ32935.1 FtsX-like permease family protein [Arenimonas terrae]